ncbi:lipid kinase, YegS/Rv2252/BmrU family [Clostridium amylolyticum]|uniref:Lipid kinase, YegS/Rv2252/BmrU family n=1 Tax=Clostridium amylolyticum TaxID=1121298 RepID=A0A1M6MUL8_9CLOT|nr:diacylglycerol kinase family protein [Clostridium amylolyticum]SHJ87208.1 lipid kinase, YegS/Rv2252/BmrU family [Clostridium amylolyticum]
MKHLFIINPEAGKGKAISYLESIKNIFQDMEDEYHIEVTEHPGHATQIVKEYTSKEDYRVYAIGGDGTLNEVLNGIIGSTSSLAVIPAGSGNDFVKNIVSEEDEDILLKTINGKEKYMDLGKVNDRYFINISSVGFDSEVVYNAKSMKKIKYISGSTAYIIGILKTLFNFNPIHAEITIDEMKFNRDILLAAIANGKCYGGGIKIAPDSSVFDGIFDICLIDKVSKLKIFFLFPQVIKGKHKNIKEVKFYKAKKVSINSSKEFVINIDGELIKDKHIDFEIIHHGIKVVMPEAI